MQLTQREEDVYKLILKGFTYKEIASTLYLSTTTIKHHVRSLLHKKGVPNKEALLVQELISVQTKLDRLAKEYQLGGSKC